MNKLLDEIRNIVGSAGILLEEDVSSRSDTWPPMGGCQAQAIIRPANTLEISDVLKLCHAAGQGVVSHGGLTGLVGGAKAGKEDIVLSLERMNSMETVDTVNRTITVDAGVPLQKVQEAAEEAELLFPLDLGARGSCTIGGNISTNAGGNSVIRYGMIRDQLLGVEAVLADGTIISSLNRVIKNNTGYDLKQLFIGSEGTLGIVTRAVLRLRPLPRSCNTALVAIEDFAQLGQFLADMDSALGGTLSAFEVMWNDFYRLVVGDGSKHGQPLETSHGFYVLLESTGGHVESDKAGFESALEEAFERGLIVDAVIAQSKQQRENLWAIRDDIEGLNMKLNPSIVFDISLGIPQMDEYAAEVREQLTERWPDSQMVVFGHLGDGNIHLALTIGSLDPVEVRAVETIVYEALGRRRGVISAEHGIGALDPKGILNPGRIFEQQENNGNS